MRIDTALLVVGDGPGPLVAAKVAGGWGLGCLLVGHEFVGGPEPVMLSEEAVDKLRPHGLFDVLRPYLDAVNPPTIAALTFEEGIKHHCVVDMNVTVFDGLALTERAANPDGSIDGVLSDGTARWEIHADAIIDGADLPTELSAAILAGSAAADLVLDAVRAKAAIGRPS